MGPSGSGKLLPVPDITHVEGQCCHTDIPLVHVCYPTGNTQCFDADHTVGSSLATVTEQKIINKNLCLIAGITIETHDHSCSSPVCVGMVHSHTLGEKTAKHIDCQTSDSTIENHLGKVAHSSVLPAQNCKGYHKESPEVIWKKGHLNACADGETQETIPGTKADCHCNYDTEVTADKTATNVKDEKCTSYSTDSRTNTGGGITTTSECDLNILCHPLCYPTDFALGTLHVEFVLYNPLPNILKGVRFYRKGSGITN